MLKYDRGCSGAIAAIVIASVVLFWAEVVSAQTNSKFPALTGRVVDNAELLSPTREASLTEKLKAHEAATGQQVVVATIISLQGDDIDGYTNRLFRHWALGDKERNDGVLLLVAKNDRKLRIEVGYGLEGVLTDALSAYIIRQAIVPKFKQGNFELGIIDGSDQILTVLTSDEAELAKWQGQSQSQPKKSNPDPEWPFFLFFAVWFLFMFGFPLFHFLAKRYGEKLGADRYRWLGIELDTKARARSNNSGWSGGGGGWSGGGGGFSGGGGSSGGGGASGGW